MSINRDGQLVDLQAHAEHALRLVTDLDNHLAGIGHIPATPLTSFGDARLGLQSAGSALRHLVLQVAYWRQHESDEARRLAEIRAAVLAPPEADS